MSPGTRITCAACGNGVIVSVAPDRLHEYVANSAIDCRFCGAGLEVRAR